MANILIGGDVCPVGRNAPLFEEGDARGVFHELLEEFGAADVSVVNLECPLLERAAPVFKSGPVLGARRECVRGLKNAHIDVISLANNHILDHGAEGLRNTVKVCREAGMEVVGAGENLAEAGTILCRQVQDLRMGIMAVAEHEGSIATRDTPGANPLDGIEFVRQLRKQRHQFEYLIVLVHGGKEYYPYPSPELQRVCRFMIEEGANAVICQHSHCPGCYERYEGGYIVYGQGNLLFDRPEKEGEWNRGFLVRLSVRVDKTAEMDLIPYLQSDERSGARRMNGDEEAAFRRDLEARSARIRERSYVEQNWQEFCQEKRHLYFSILRGHSRLFRALNRVTHFTDWFYTRRELASLQNVIRCEAHREVLQTILSAVQDRARQGVPSGGSTSPHGCAAGTRAIPGGKKCE